MVNPFLRHAHEREEEDKHWSTDWDDHLTESPSSEETGIPFNPFTTDLDSETMPAASPTNPSFPSVSIPPGVPTPTDRDGFKSLMQSLNAPHSTTLQTSTSSADQDPYSEITGQTTLPSKVSDNVPQPTSTDSDDFGNNKNPPELQQKSHSSHGAMYAAAAVVPIVVIGILAVLVFFYLRKRKRARNATAGGALHAKEMKSRNQPIVAARYASNSPSPPPSAQPQHASPPSTPPPSLSPITPQPVILGPIGASSNGAYFTGIDTSDAASVNERTGLGDPFADGNSIQDEAPPPYRPSSLPPLSIAPSSRNSSLRLPSRNSSLRHPAAAGQSTANLIPRSQPTERSPFADPDDDDNVSEVSAPTSRRHQDALSVVSDLSYQDEPMVTRPSV